MFTLMGMHRSPRAVLAGDLQQVAARLDGDAGAIGPKHAHAVVGAVEGAGLRLAHQRQATGDDAARVVGGLLGQRQGAKQIDVGGHHMMLAGYLDTSREAIGCSTTSARQRGSSSGVTPHQWAMHRRSLKRSVTMR